MITVVKYLNKRVDELQAEYDVAEFKFAKSCTPQSIEYNGNDMHNLKMEMDKFKNAIQLITKNGLYK
jgi:hypothetical protein